MLETHTQDMQKETYAPIALTSAQIAFALGNVVIYAGSADDEHNAHLAHGYACCIDADGAVRIYIDAQHAAALVTDIRCNGHVAVAFAHPGSEQALQLKAIDAEIIAADETATAAISHYCERLVAHIHSLGFDEAMLRAFLEAPAEAVALRFKPYIAFDQTPGPNAGAKIEVIAC